MAAPFRLYNTLTRRVEPFEPVKPGHVGIYCCGMTVYDDCHAGHARAFIIFDAFVRRLRARGWSVRFVRNYTDVDDKIIHRANERGEDPAALADRYVAAFARDAAALGLAPPDAEPRVTTSMDDIVAMIERLVGQGHAYAVDGNVWFAVRTAPRYGQLSGQAVDALGSSADPDSGKRDPLDFALWKSARAGDPSWPSPWGPGRPGWHIECSAMAARHLGETIDIHGGGLDLVFPHHENEVAQSECAHGARFSNWFMHNGLLTMPGGRKMGKSEGNAFTVVDLTAAWPAEAIRLYYLQNHYRSPLAWTPDSIAESLAMLDRLVEAREVASRMTGDGEAARLLTDLGADAAEVWRLGNAFEAAFHAALDDDFNTAAALGLAFELARAVNRFANHKRAAAVGAPVVAPALRALALLPPHLGLLQTDVGTWQAELAAKVLPRRGTSANAVDALVADRTAARNGRDWARADALRTELDALGIAVMDRDGHTTWRVRVT